MDDLSPYERDFNQHKQFLQKHQNALNDLKLATDKIEQLERTNKLLKLAHKINKHHPGAVDCIVEAASLFQSAIRDIGPDQLSQLTDQSSSNIEDELIALAKILSFDDGV